MFSLKGYTDEPVAEILSNMSKSQTVLLDRWHVEVEKNTNADSTEQDGKDNLPLNVINNYFSLGVDAHIALEFHEARGKSIFEISSKIRLLYFHYCFSGNYSLIYRIFPKNWYYSNVYRLYIAYTSYERK